MLAFEDQLPSISQPEIHHDIGHDEEATIHSVQIAEGFELQFELARLGNIRIGGIEWSIRDRRRTQEEKSRNRCETCCDRPRHGTKDETFRAGAIGGAASPNEHSESLEIP